MISTLALRSPSSLSSTAIASGKPSEQASWPDLEDNQIPLSLSEVAHRVRQLHQYCQDHPQHSLPHARNAGDLLQQVKSVLNDSEWKTWLTYQCSLKESTVQLYLAIARSWPGFSQVPHVAKPQRLLQSTELQSTEPASDPAQHQEVPLLTVPSDTQLEVISTEQGAPIAPVTPLLCFILPGTVVPKARPRVTRNGTHMPKRYQEWRQQAEGELILQLAQHYEHLELPLKQKQLRVEIELRGKQRRNADGDNIIGSCLDALVAVGVFKNDSLSYIPELGFKYVSQGSQEVQISVLTLK